MFGCAWKINFPEIIFNWLCVLKALTWKWFEVKISLQTISGLTWRERERETQSSDQAPVRRPQIEPITPRRSRKDRIALFAALRTSLFLLLSIWPNLMNFFFLSFVSFVFLYWGMILYICLAAEKMWATSRKCVFYGIFKNTTKHQKIAFLKNKYFSKNILHELNTALLFKKDWK